MKLPLVHAAIALAVLCPLVSAQEIKLLPNDGAADDYFGYSVAISGTTTIVGAYGDDPTGSVYLFDSSAGTQIAKLLPSEDAWGFGFSVAISGNTAIVGAQADDDNGDASGSAYLFDTTTGTQTAKLLPSDGAPEDRFGQCVAISGNTAIVGAPHDDDNGSDSGSAYLFDITTGAQIAKLLPSDGASEDYFGVSVGISGNTAIVGAHFDDDNGLESGSAYLFDITTGAQIEKLLPSDGAPGDRFGNTIAISGTTAIAGAFYDDNENGAYAGSAYLFDVSNPQAPVEIAKLLPNDGAGIFFAWGGVSISGTTAIVGATFDDDNGVDSGSAYLFETTTGAQIAKLLPSDGASEELFGNSVAISGTTAIVGVYRDDDNGFSSGSAYLFETDCNNNGVLDLQDIANDPSLDCDQNGYIDSCELSTGVGDCNLNGVFDACECLNGTVQDCNANLIPDLCEPLPDCNGDGLFDECDIAAGALDCDNNEIPDSCDIAGGEPDLNGNGIPDQCECFASSYCSPNPNSTGVAVQIGITGTPSITLNSLHLDAAGGPPNQPGLFFHGPGTANQTFGEGIRCVSTPILRVETPVFFGSGGAASKHLDMTAAAQSNIQPADTRYFQIWYRDPTGGSSGFNLSNGLEITFCP